MNPKIFPEKKQYLFIFILLIIFLFFYRLDYLPLKFEEPRRALVATEMIISGNYWVPTINGEFYYNKPPLFNWLIAGLFNIFGFSEWVERFPTFLSIIGFCIVNFIYFRRRIGVENSALASFCFALSGHMLFYFSFQGEIDMTYSFVVYLQVLCIIHFFDKKNYLLLFMTSYLLMTVGVLMKGLPSIAFQGLTLLGFFLWHRRFGKLFHPTHFLALGISVFLLSYYFRQYGAYNDPELLIAKLTVESVSRSVGDMDITHYSVQLVKFPLLILYLMLPWSLLFFAPKKYAWKSLRENKWVSYCLLFLIVNTWLYWISPGTRDRYIYAFLPFFYNVLIFVSADWLRRKNHIVSIALYSSGSIISMSLLVLPFIDVRFPFIWSIVTVLSITILLWSVTKKKLHAVFGFLALMFFLRIYYDQVIFPIRAKSRDNIAAISHANEVLKIVNGEKLEYVSPVSESQMKLPFQAPVTIKEIGRLPYQFSFYYSSQSGQIIEWKEEPGTNFYITAVEKELPQTGLYTFEAEGGTFVLHKKGD